MRVGVWSCYKETQKQMVFTQMYDNIELDSRQTTNCHRIEEKNHRSQVLEH